MDTNTYNQIETSWTSLINQAKTKLDNVLTTEDLLNLSVRDLKDLVSFCRDFQSNMDCLFEDYRHIIGMGDCTVIQRNKLTTLLREIEQYRSDTKRIATIKDLDIVKLIPAQSTYKLKLNSNIKLTSKLRLGQTEAVHIDNDVTVKNAKVNNVENYELNLSNDETIEIRFKDDKDDIIAVRNLLATANGSALSNRLCGARTKLLASQDWFNCSTRQEANYFIVKVENKDPMKQIFNKLKNLMEE